MSDKKIKHKWSRSLKGFVDTDSYCTVCGIRRERHGILGIWF